ncbi:MAG: T9SS type A sorting domain-containing protein [Cyclobacteriaceae bacterium]
MKNLFLVLLLSICTIQIASAQLWTENFDSYADGVTSGTAGGSVGGNWSSTVPGGGTFEKGSTLGERFYSYQTGGEGVWTTSPINTSGTGRALIEMNVFGLLVGAGDYIRCYYKVDSGPEILFFEQVGGLLNFSLTGSAIITGSSLEIVIRSDVDGILTSFSFDDVVVTAVNTLYSRKSGNWNDGTIGNATWSAASLGGISCDCTPLTTDYLIIGNSNTVDINVAATAGGIEVQNTGVLRWTSVNDLNVDRGILQVNLGGSINRNGQAGVQIDFDRGIVNSMIVNGTITTEDIEITAANASLNITGSGSISLIDDFRIIEDDIVVTNDLTGTFTIGDDLVFDQPGDVASDDSEFINNQNLTITSDIVVGANNDDDNIFTNSAGAILNVVTINPTDADFDFLNSGTVNQSGDFSNIAAGDTNIDNLGSGTWNWNFVQAAFDADLTTVLNCTATGNNFNYGAAGNQRIIPVSYHHLSLTNSGAKDSNNTTFSVAGNWTVSGATFTEGTGTITLNGAGTTVQTISNSAGETFNILIINNTSTANIIFSNAVTVSNTLTMTSGIVNLSNTTFTLGSSGVASDLNRTASTTTNWMYGGSFRRFWPTGQTPSPTAGNLYGLFPLGHSTASSYRPVAITAGSNITATGSVTFNHVNASSVTDLSPLYDDDPTAGVINIVRKHNAQFIGSTSGIVGGTNYTISVTMTNLLAGTASDIRLAVSNGATTVTNVGAHVANSGTAPSPVVGRSGLTVANLTNDFRITTINSTNTPLPIELLDFNAKQVDSQVVLNWSTASELNNDFFTIERLNEEDSFSEVVRVKGSGTINESRSYQVYDRTPKAGKNYYRLKQTDFDGQFSYSKIVMVDFNEIGEAVNLYPNPVNQKTLTIEVKQLKSGQQVPLQITSMLGVQTFSAFYNADSAGRIRVSIQVDQWSLGLYLVQIGMDTPVLRKIVIE